MNTDIQDVSALLNANGEPANALVPMTGHELQAIGLTAADGPEIQRMVALIDANNPLTVDEFGKAVADHASGHIDGMLQQVRNRDIEVAGSKLTEVVTVARSLNLQPLSDRRSTLPIIGPLIDKFKVKTEGVRSQFESTLTQIERLLGEIDQTQNNLGERNAALESTFESVIQEQRILGLHIAAGQIKLEEIRAELTRDFGQSTDPVEMQRLADMNTVANSLDKRIADLRVLQQSSFQSLPTIRMIQSSNRQLIDKFHTIRQVTVPSWKRQFMIALTLNEQKNAAELTKSIDDANNELLRRNAKLVHQNAVATAKSNQRLAIDVETLQDVQDTLVRTVEDVLRVQREGVAKRHQVVKQIEAMRGDLQLRLAKPASAA